MKRFLVFAILFMATNLFSATITFENLQVFQGYGVEKREMPVVFEEFTVEVDSVDSTVTLQIMIESHYEFHGIGFDLVWDDSLLVIPDTSVVRGNLFPDNGIWGFNRIGDRQFYISLALQEGSVFQTEDGIFIIAEFDLTVRRSRLYIEPKTWSNVYIE